jgi:hypothetical protein
VVRSRKEKGGGDFENKIKNIQNSSIKSLQCLWKPAKSLLVKVFSGSWEYSSSFEPQ